MFQDKFTTEYTEVTEKSRSECKMQIANCKTAAFFILQLLVCNFPVFPSVLSVSSVVKSS